MKVYANKPSFRTVEFNETRLSFIVAKQKDLENKSNGKTYNKHNKLFYSKLNNILKTISDL